VILDGLLIGIYGVGILVLAAFTILSRQENASRAAWFSIGLAIVLVIALIPSLSLPVPLKMLIALLPAAILGFTFLLIALSPISQGSRMDRHERFDERDVVFSRANLQPGSNFEAYYARRPENLADDEKFRAQPGLLSPDALKAEPLTFSAAESSFDVTEFMRPAVEGPVADRKTSADMSTLTAFIKGLALHLGAHSVGITELNPMHVYSHIGRGAGKYGEPVELNHRNAIAFTVEMDHSMMRRAPQAPVVLESARKYVDAAVIAVQIANLCRRLGYPARAHIDGNYRVIAPLVARDAGLGEIGRIGILMTPRLGPRVRLGIVTTDLPLITDGSQRDPSILAFCEICEKCAEGCPSKAIPFGPRRGGEGGLRWKLDENKCFHYWNVIGTDCGLCMTICPYSHPDRWAHNLMRMVVRRSRLLQRTALWLDDLFYGRKPTPGPQPDWLPISSRLRTH
jgi:ferredoxin